MKNLFSSAAMTALLISAPVTLVNADQVILDDLIINGSACIGLDCVNGESFGFDTLRLKENNLRIRAFDTSSSASFPSNDWQITFNDSSNGGANKFSIDDIDRGRTPFTIEAGARNNALYVDDGGRIGIGTNNPVVNLQVVTGNTPTTRLEQDGSSGFTPQTWDVAGNEANFFIRDATNGSTLPFRIFPGAPSNALTIEGTTGDIGIGTTSPAAVLHIKDTAGGGIEMIRLENNGGMFIAFLNTVTSKTWNLNHSNGSGDFIFSHSAVPGARLSLTQDGTMTLAGGLITGGGGSCASPNPACDAVFDPAVYTVPSITEHAALMWKSKFLPAVGPTGPGQQVNVPDKMLRILNELEHAHIYIEQLHDRMTRLEARLAIQQ